jgi:hypothetical protein
MEPYFKSEFKRQSTTTGKYTYWFNTLYTQDDENRNEKYPLFVNGINIEPEVNIDKESYYTKPDDLDNPLIIKNVYLKWISDCSGAFVKCPSIEQCISKSESVIDSDSSIATIYPEEEDNSWTLQWIPTKIKVDMPKFQIHWSPSYKIPYKSRIVIDDEADTNIKTTEKTIELQTHEKPRTDWLQEMADLHVPFVDSSTLRLESELEAQKEKHRRKVRDARIRAKLSKYRAEREAVRYEEKYGIYPEEDADEAQTEAESNSDE